MTTACPRAPRRKKKQQQQQDKKKKQHKLGMNIRNVSINFALKHKRFSDRIYSLG